jgi:hypothetical protein
MLTMLGYNRHVMEHKKNMDEYRRIVMALNKGQWSKGNTVT